MINMLIVTHGLMADGIKDTVEMIMGPQPDLKTLSLKQSQDVDDFTNELKTIISQFEPGAEILVFVDLYGATPFNTTSMLRNYFLESNYKVQLITGVNLPMVLEALMKKEGSTMIDVVKLITESSKDSIEDLNISYEV